MSHNLVLFAMIFSVLTACSGTDSTAEKSSSEAAVKSKVDTGAKNDALMGYKRSLDTAKSVTSMAAENEKKKQQMLQDIQ